MVVVSVVVLYHGQRSHTKMVRGERGPGNEATLVIQVL